MQNVLMKMKDRADCVILVDRRDEEMAKFSGRYDVVCIGSDGEEKWRDTAYNMIVNQGLNHILNVVFHAVTAIATWYIGLIRDDSYTAIAATDTLASHTGWQEGTEYSGNRKEWTEGTAASQTITNSATVDFAINATQVMKGMFLASVNTGGTGSDLLMSAALFSQGDRAVQNGDTVRVTYTMTAADV